MVTFLACRALLKCDTKACFLSGIPSNEVNEVDYFAAIKTFVKFAPTVINADLVAEQVYKKLFL